MKKKIRETGEIVDVVTYVGGTSRTSMDEVMCVDSKGEQKCLKLNYYWDLEDINEFSSGGYWDNFRNEAAVKIYCAMRGNPTESFNSVKSMDIAIQEADNLINKLKNSKK